MPTLEEQTIYDLRSEVQRLQDLAEGRAQHNTMLTEELRGQYTLVEHLEQRLAQLEHANAALQATCAEQDEKIAWMREGCAAMDTRIRELLTHNTQLVEEKRDRERQRDGSRERVALLEQNLGAVLGEVELLQEEKRALYNRLQTVRAQMIEDWDTCEDTTRQWQQELLTTVQAILAAVRRGEGV